MEGKLIAYAVLSFAFLNLLAAQTAANNSTIINPAWAYRYYLTNQTNPRHVYPEGVVSYGLSGQLFNSSPDGVVFSNSLVPYQITTNAIFGCVNITSMAMNYSNVTGAPTGFGPGLILDVNLVVNSTNNESYTYSLNDGFMFNTSDKVYQFFDSIVNYSKYGTSIISSNTVSGHGLTFHPSETASNVAFYKYFSGESRTGNQSAGTTWKRYLLPTTLCPIIKTYEQGTHPVVQFGYSINGNAGFYDNVTFSAPAKTSYMLITPYKIAPSETDLYDAEFVFGGDAIGNQNVTFNSLNATDMWMFYDSNGTFLPFPNLYTTGWNVFQGATNAKVVPSGGYAEVKVGTPNLFSNITYQDTGRMPSYYADVSSWIEAQRNAAAPQQVASNSSHWNEYNYTKNVLGVNFHVQAYVVKLNGQEKIVLAAVLAIMAVLVLIIYKNLRKGKKNPKK